MKEYIFLDGSTIKVDDAICRGCFLETDYPFPIELNPIAISDEIVVRQDAECAVPGFYIVSTREHIHSIADISSEIAAKIGIVIQVIRRGQKDILGIQRAHIYLEEKLIDPHFHVWLLPLWPEVIEASNIEPKIWNGTVKPYLDLFDYKKNRNKIIEFNNKMKRYLSVDKTMLSLGFIEN